MFVETPCYRTTDMEASIRLLAERHSHVLVNNSRVCANRIPIKERNLDDVFLWRYYPWNSVGRHHLEQWKKHGGVLVDYTQKIQHIIDYRERRGDMTCGGYLFVEAPISRVQVETWTSQVTGEIVIHQPPNWKNHIKTVTRGYETGDTAVDVYNMLRERQLRDRTPMERACARFLCIEDLPYQVIDKKELQEMTGLDAVASSKVFRKIRWQVATSRFDMISPIIPRVRPDEPAMRAVYDVIVQQPDLGMGRRALTRKRAYEVARNYRGIIKRLDIEGYIEKCNNLHVIVIDPKRKPRPQSINRAVRSIRAELQVLSDWVDGLPDYLRAPLPESAWHASLGALAHADGTAR